MAKILIVDDEEHIRKLYSAVLGQDGFETAAVGNGHEAVEYVRDNAVDIVILDIEMEDTSGLEVLKQIKEIRPDAAVVLNTAYSIYMSDFKSWMAEDYIVKSSDLQPLRDKINQLVKV